jgi:hypothetical protein
MKLSIFKFVSFPLLDIDKILLRDLLVKFVFEGL